MPNFKAQSSNQATSPNDKVYDLEERTARFGEYIIVFAKTVVKDEITRSLISQLVRAGTSIDANYMEADGAESKKGLTIRLLSAKKNRKKQNIGLE